MSHAKLSAEQSASSSSTEAAIDDAASTLAAIESGEAVPRGPRAALALRAAGDIFLIADALLKPNKFEFETAPIVAMVRDRICLLANSINALLDDAGETLPYIFEHTYPDEVILDAGEPQ